MRALMIFVGFAAMMAIFPVAQAADANKPHDHQGVAPKFTSPTATVLSAKETADLVSGKSVRKQIRYETHLPANSVNQSVFGSTDFIKSIFADAWKRDKLFATLLPK